MALRAGALQGAGAGDVALLKCLDRANLTHARTYAWTRLDGVRSQRKPQCGSSRRRGRRHCEAGKPIEPCTGLGGSAFGFGKPPAPPPGPSGVGGPAYDISPNQWRPTGAQNVITTDRAGAPWASVRTSRYLARCCFSCRAPAALHGDTTTYWFTRVPTAPRERAVILVALSLVALRVAKNMLSPRLILAGRSRRPCV